MYEENLEPLPDGDAAAVFAEKLAALRGGEAIEHGSEVTPETVVRWADETHQPLIADICRRLLLPGSRIEGVENLRRLAALRKTAKPASSASTTARTWMFRRCSRCWKTLARRRFFHASSGYRAANSK